MKILIVAIILFVLISGGLYFFLSQKEPKEEKVYQGPVRPTDDEAYFRKTGITKPLEIKE